MTQVQVPIDAPAVAIDGLYDRFHDRFATGATLPAAYRIYNLKQLAYMIKDNEEAIKAAVLKDLGKGDFDVYLGDIWIIYNEVELAVRRLESWMKDESRMGDSILSMQVMRPRVKKQPKGVALILSTWNFFWQLTLTPLIGAIAAGCPAIVKPSEHAPTSSALLAEILPRYLDSEAYGTVLGGSEVAKALLAKPWGHIFYTGGGEIGKIVAKAAAQTLTPSTLELGGKSPVIVSSCADLKIAARRMFSIKTLAAGQMCVSPDYVLCAKDRVDEFVEFCKQTLDEFYPPAPSPLSLLSTPQYAFLRTDAAYDRLVGYIDQADREGKLVYKGERDEEKKKMGISVIRLAEGAVGETGKVVEEEIFGPVMAIIPVENVDAAIKYVNAGPHPLALYVCSSKRQIFTKIIHETTSGSATWNDFGFATFARNIPFGGVGASGWGSYHGVDGFNTFSHSKAVLEIPYIFEPLMSLRYPPLGSWQKTVLTWMLFVGIPFGRPESVEAEAAILWRKKWGWRAVYVAALAVATGGLVYQGKPRGF
ncbi:aldehyde dehydrogenase (NAD+) [Cryptococcus wingfieldii CBS 7118]|uniref:Aldehyde dehydrogenase n=1 Tax=Cryptococcus wingfieldii CBS 7118 TaxID=1295528 RepID=A0A1E3IUH6_9TREE|nr:aldehyde dehydrogenase (NAD+) [Cryptococcus wingfieldii CBS 7118]ODN92095.1 aldehyde dehydrogenase (NAD+) [Cryptococcus wingfieldii CBS 7118]